MNPQTIRNPTQLYKVREAYLANLELEQRNLQKTADAVSSLAQTGQVPLAPQDTRSLNEKLGDVEKLKVSLRRQLMGITDGQQASDIMNALSNDEVQALSVVFGEIASVLKAKFTSGVPAPIFLEYARRYLKSFSTNAGLASGNQNVAAEELKLTRDMIQRVMPSPPIMEELARALAFAPESRAKQEAVAATERLARAFPDINDIAAQQSILSEVELTNLSSLITDALEATPSAAQVQKLTKEIIDALRSGSKSESDNILFKVINVMNLEAAELAELNRISAGLRQEQLEEERKANITRPSPNVARLIDEVATIMNSRLVTRQIPTGEKRINRRGREVDVTVPETRLFEKGTITAADRRVANDVFLLDRLSIDELTDEVRGVSTLSKINIPGFIKYFDYIAKLSGTPGISTAEQAELKALSKAELADRFVAFKTGKPTLAREKAAAKQETTADIGGISAGAKQQQQQPKAKLDIQQKAIYDNSQGKLMEIDDFMALDDADVQLAYLGYLLAFGTFDVDLGLKADIEDIVARDPNTLKQQTVLGVYDRVKRVTGMGMKKKGKPKNIVFGCGLAKTATRPKKQFVEKIDFSEGLPKDKSYIPFGKYVLHKHKLTGGILQVKTIKGGAIPKLPTIGISPSLGKIIKKMVGGGLPTYDEMSALNEDEKNTLYKVFKLSQIDKADMLPSPDKTKEEQEMNRFQILKGQIQAGNDNADLIKEFKCMLMRFISGGKIPRGQGMDIVCELMSLGY